MSSSPSGSLKNWLTGDIKLSPSSMPTSGTVPTATGARLAASTVTITSCRAKASSGSVAVTATIAMPSATAMIVTAEPSIVAVAASVFVLSTVKVSSSSSGSLKLPETSRVTVSPSVRFWGGIVSVTTGDSLRASTVKLTDSEADAPSGSVAVTVTVAVPSVTASTVMMAPDMEAVTTPEFDEVAE